MKIVEFKDYDNQTTPLSAYNLNRLQQNLITTKYQMTFSSAVSGGSTITLPCYYQVGQDTLDVYLNSELLKKASTKDSEGHYYEVGNSDTKSNQIKITSDWSIASGDVLNLIVRGTTDSYDQNLSPDKATQLADEISANKEEITALQTENSRLKGITNALPKISGEDTSLTLTNTANAPLSDIILKGNTSQQQYSGKNLLPLIKGDYNVFNNNVNWKIHNEIIVYNRTNENIQGGAINLVTGAVGQWGNEGKDLQLKPNTTYTFSFVANGNYTKKENTTAFIKLFLYKGKQLLIYDKNSNNKYTTTFTTDDTGYFGVCLYGQYITCTNFMIYNIQLEEGSTATDYEPYVGGTASPNPDYPQEIHCVKGNNKVVVSNQNLFDKDNANILNGYTNGTTKTYQELSTAKSCYISIKPNTTYTISKISSQRFGLATFNTEIINGTTATIIGSPESTDTSYTITTGGNDKYLVVFYYLSTADTLSEETIRNSIQIEQGSTATSYVTHKGTEYEINLGNIELNAIEDFKDYFKKEKNKWYKVENIGSYTFEGNENFSFKDAGTINQRFDIQTSALNISSQQEYKYKLFTHFRSSTSNSGVWGEYYMSSDLLVIKDNDNKMTSLEDFKAWLSANKPTIYYARISPIDIEITDTTLITQLNALYNAYTYNDTTNITQTNANLPFYINAEAFKKIS